MSDLINDYCYKIWMLDDIYEKDKIKLVEELWKEIQIRKNLKTKLETS